MMFRGRQFTCMALCAAGSSLAAQHASAADWQVTPAAHVGTAYVDNPRLLTSGSEQSSGAIGELNAMFRRLTERTELSLRPRMVSSRYSDDDTLDTDDQFLTAGYKWLGERSEWTTEATVIRDTTLTSELGSTGLIQSNRRHEAFNFAIAPRGMVTERVSVGMQMFLTNNKYEDADFTGLVDYRYKSLSVFSTLLLTDAGSAVTLTAQGGELHTSGNRGLQTIDGSVRLGWTFQPWQLWTVSLSGGPSVVDADAGSDDGYVFDGEVRREGDRWSLTTKAGRSQSPTGRGVLTRRDEVKLTFNRQLTERLTANVAARWVRSEDLFAQFGGATTFEVDYGRLDLGANWRLSRNWSLSLQLSGNTQDYELAPERAHGYRASLSMVWNGQPQSL